MELITGLFILGLYKATEKIWEKGFDAAWGPVDEALKARFAHWAGKGKEAERGAAFAKAAGIACANTLRAAADPQQAQKILDALNGGRDKKGAKALAEEGAKLMLFSATPDVPRLTRLCQERLHWDAVWGEGKPPAAETVAVVLSDFLANLREALLDQEPYHDLIEKDMRRALNDILAELRPVPYDDEATYRSQVAEMYRQLEFVGIPELKERRPVTVEDIFIRLRTIIEGIEEALSILTPRERRVLQLRGGLVDGRVYSVEEVAPKFGLTVEEVRSIEDAARARLPIVSETTQVHEAVQRYTRLVILGDPGAGKTTLLKYLTVICAEGRAEVELGLKADGAGPPLPIFVTLREFAAECAGRDQDYCLLDYFYTHAREHLMLNLPRDFFEDALNAGRCLVCLDGLDEVWAVGQRKKITDAVKALAARFPDNRYVVTSRIVGYEEAPLDRREFTHHTVLPLTDDDIREFVHKWYEVRERDPIQRKQKVDDLIATIEREPRIQNLARNPLLLTIIALVHRIEAELPHERVKLYDKCVTTLVDTWEEVKGLTIEEKQRPFYRQRRRLLERLAYELHTRATPLTPPAGGGTPGGLQTIKAGDLELLLARFLMENRRLGYADDPDSARDEARAFIRLARGRTGLLVERGEGVFGFPHLTFQEYLAACDIENRCIHHGVDAIWGEIEPHLHDSHWREVILLLLGSLSKHDEPSTLLVERILKTGKEDKFEPVLHRHLYLATRILADRVSVADDLHRRIITEILTVVRCGHWIPTAVGFTEDEPGPVVEASGEAVDAIHLLRDLKGDAHVAEGILFLILDQQAEVWVRVEAISALSELGWDNESAVGCILSVTMNPKADDYLRSRAVEALGHLGCTEEKVLDSLLAVARDMQTDTMVRYAAISALGKLGRIEEKTVCAVLNLAHDRQVDAWARRAAAETLSELGHAKEAADVFLALVRDERVDDWVRVAAAQGLGQLGHAEKAAEALLALTRDEHVNARVRCAAAEALGQTEEAARILLDIAHDKQAEDYERRDAAHSLSRLGRVQEAAETLLALARDEQGDAWIRYDATNALGQLGHTEEAAEILLTLVRDTQIDEGVRKEAIEALSQLSRTEEKVLDGLLVPVSDNQMVDWVRRQAIGTLLGQMGRAEEAKEILLALACDVQVDDLVRCAATQALGQLGCAEDEVLDTLLMLVCDTQLDGLVRRSAISALGQLERAEEKVLSSLLALARDERADDWVRSDAYESLKRLVGGATANSE